MRNSILGWAGTLLGAVGLLLALSTVPATWVNQYQALDAFLIALTVLCLAIVVIVPLTLARALVRGTRFRWKAWQAARHPIPYHVDYRIIPTTATGARNIRFTTDDEDRRFVMTPGQAVALRITAPFEATVWASAVPAPVRYFGKTIFTVTEFLPLGFVITDQSPGLQVDGEVSYSQLVQITPPPPPPALEDSEGNQDQAAPGTRRAEALAQARPGTGQAVIGRARAGGEAGTSIRRTGSTRACTQDAFRGAMNRGGRDAGWAGGPSEGLTITGCSVCWNRRTNALRHQQVFGVQGSKY